jgi:hypothetical protein
MLDSILQYEHLPSFSINYALTVDWNVFQTKNQGLLEVVSAANIDRGVMSHSKAAAQKFVL